MLALPTLPGFPPRLDELQGDLVPIVTELGKHTPMFNAAGTPCLAQPIPVAGSHLPASLLHFMSTRGKNRIMFASDSPVLSMTRCVKEAAALDLPADVLDAYLYQNAQAFFFGGEG